MHLSGDSCLDHVRKDVMQSFLLHMYEDVVK